jgi:NADH:ubiquinone oxidoreductase subunit 5 (subunit L)/multisubunit Na+/H+ antiporter MnhA subunit
MLPWIGMEVTGAVLLAVGLAGESATAVVAAGSAAWALGIAVLFLGSGLQREALWWSIPALIGALALLGMPLTLGFVAETTLIEGLTKEGHLGWGGALFFGNLFLVPSLVRWLLSPSSSPLNNQRWLLVARGVSLGLLALLLIAAGLHPPLLIHGAMAPSLGALFTMPGVAGWLLWAVSLAGGGVLAWQEGNLRPKIEPLLSAAHDLLRLEWLYDMIVRAIDRGLSALRAADEIVGGAGALLWSWLLFLLILLVWGGL